MKKSNVEQRITDALFDLMEIDPIEKITVSEICAVARINRSTFYNHFSDIYNVRDRYEEIFFETVDDVLPKFMKAKFLGNGNFSVELIGNALGPHFDKLKVLLNGGDPLFSAKITDIARKNFVSILGITEFTSKQEYIFSALTGMQLSLIGHWLRSEKTISLEELVMLMQNLIEYGPKKAILSGVDRELLLERFL